MYITLVNKQYKSSGERTAICLKCACALNELRWIFFMKPAILDYYIYSLPSRQETEHMIYKEYGI